MKRYLNQRLKLRLLRVIATVASQGSLLKAAEVLGLTQPALTKSLREIEDIVGVRLFDRHARGVLPNEYGVILADAAHKILNILSEVENGFDRIDTRVGGTVFVGALPTAAAGVIPGVIRQISDSDTQIAMRVVEGRTGELSTALALGDIDVVVGRLYSSFDEAGQFEKIPLYDEPMSFVVGNQHPLAEYERVDIADVMRYEISLPVASLRIRADTQEYLDALGLQLQDGFATTSLTLQREMMLNSNLVTIIPWLMLKGDIDRGTLKALKLAAAGKPPARPAGILFRRDRLLSTAATHFISVVTEYARVALPQYEP